MKKKAIVIIQLSIFRVKNIELKIIFHFFSLVSKNPNKLHYTRRKNMFKYFLKILQNKFKCNLKGLEKNKVTIVIK